MDKTRDYPYICPVKALFDYLRLRGQKKGMWKNGSPLQKPQFN